MEWRSDASGGGKNGKSGVRFIERAAGRLLFTDLLEMCYTTDLLEMCYTIFTIKLLLITKIILYVANPNS